VQHAGSGFEVLGSVFSNASARLVGLKTTFAGLKTRRVGVTAIGGDVEMRRAWRWTRHARLAASRGAFDGAGV